MESTTVTTNAAIAENSTSARNAASATGVANCSHHRLLAHGSTETNADFVDGNCLVRDRAILHHLLRTFKGTIQSSS